MLDLIRAVLTDDLPVGHLIDYLQIERQAEDFVVRLRGFTKPIKHKYLFNRYLRVTLFDLLVTYGTKEERKRTWKLFRHAKKEHKAVVKGVYLECLKSLIIDRLLVTQQ